MGLSDFKRLREQLERIPEQMPTFVGDCVVAYREEIADLNREQLEKGETPQETPIRPAYANPAYAYKKNIRNSKPAFGTPDLKNTGDFVNSIRVDAFSDSLELRATDKKAQQLFAKYGYVLGLSQSNILRLQSDILKPYLVNRIRLLLQ